MKVKITHDDRNEIPGVTGMDGYGTECEVPEETVERWEHIHELSEGMFEEMEAVFQEAIKKTCKP